MSFFDELKRRNVFRVGIAYLVVAWLTLQVIDIVAPILELPDVFSKGVLFLLAIGLPITLIMAWAFELTPEGVKKEKDVDRSASVTRDTGRKLNFIITGVLAVAVALFAMDKFIWTGEPTPETAVSDDQKTIAVLPFINMSSDEEQEYFSDGLTEELLNLLARIPQLRVTSRSSAFYYKGKDIKIAEVGRELGVGHILEGSVRRSGDTIRITAQLINVADDAHVWSDTWDRTFSDIFTIQDEIAQAVVDELSVRLVGETPRAVETDPEAYSLYLRARHLIVQRSIPSYKQALDLLRAAVAIDPALVSAWLAIGDIYWDGRGIGLFTVEEAKSGAHEAANRITELDPENAKVHLLLAQIASAVEADIETARREIDRALELGPNDFEIVRTAGFYSMRTGDVDAALIYYEKAKSLDPVGVGSWYGLGLGELGVGRFDRAEAAFRKAVELAPEGVGNHQRLAMTLLIQGKHELALEEVSKEVVEARRTSVRALIFQSMGEIEKAKVEHEKLIDFGERWTYEIARMYAHRNMPDEAFHWIERAFARSDSSLWFVSWDPFLDNIRGDPRFASVEDRLGIERNGESPVSLQ